MNKSHTCGLLGAVLMFTILPVSVRAQWKIQDSHSTANLRSVDNTGNGVVWASGTEGTILHTADNGKTWARCTTPPDAESLDFRGIKGIDALNAIVMSHGAGSLSRLYVTTDGCKSWSLLLTNPDSEGSFVALQSNLEKPAAQSAFFMLVGEPVKGRFSVWLVRPFPKDSGTWTNKMWNHRITRLPGLLSPRAKPGQIAFAVSNSSLVATGGQDGILGVGGAGGSGVFSTPDGGGYGFKMVPVGTDTASSGITSLAFSTWAWWPLRQEARKTHTLPPVVMVAVGGDSLKPDDGTSSAAYTEDPDKLGKSWIAARTQPHGYRSAVAFNRDQKEWITVGPNGTDISGDGRNWRPLTPSLGDQSDADKNWNALSLPFVVGTNGRVGILRESALTQP